MSSPLIHPPTREWSNATQLNGWLDEAKNRDPGGSSTSPISFVNGPKARFGTYLLGPRKSAKTGHCLSVLGACFDDDPILLGDRLIQVPTQWSWGDLTATQIVEGKRKPKVMRSQRLVLCCVEDKSRRWFEVAVLNKDLSYPSDPHLVGLSFFPFADYAAARRQFNLFTSKARKGATSA